jgi:DNA-binding XRE family transcriptional regulator
MKKEDFVGIRRELGKTQLQMAHLMGASLKAIQSFEQGWRNIPVHMERHALLLLALKVSSAAKILPCWEVQSCPDEVRSHCPAWELRVGNLCWFINGTICQGAVQESWGKKMTICRHCQVFQSMFLSPAKSERTRKPTHSEAH